MIPTLAAALSYLKRGWSVIPINPKSKKALVKWKTYTARLPTDAEVRAWWKRYPTASVGIVTGQVSGLVVVDVDTKRGGSTNGLPRTSVSATTPSGGQHLYFAAPKDQRVRNSVDRLATGVDVRADGGYVVAPPSHGYSWDGGEPGNRDRLPVYRDNTEVRREREDSDDEPWLSKVLHGVGAGERNDACARLAGYYVKKGIPTDVITTQLLGWNLLNDPPLSELEVRTTVESIARTALERRVASSPARFQLLDADEREGADSSNYELTSFTSYLSKHGGEPVSWLVKDWLPDQTVGLVVAPPASYKTWLLQDLAVSVASGLPFLGQFPVLKTGPVLFMQQEDWHGQIANRFALIAARRAGVGIPRMVGNRLIVHAPPRLPIFLNESRAFRFDDSEVVDAWIAQIEKLKPRLVILDPLYSAGSVQDFMAGTAREMFLFKQARDAFGTTFLIAHHTRKSARDANGGGPKHTAQSGPVTPEREDAWGSQFLNAWLETGWQLRRRDELGSINVLRHFKAAQDAKQAALTFHIDTTQTPGRYEVSVSDNAVHQERGPDITTMLEKFGPQTVHELTERTGQHRTTIHRRLVNLLSAGAIKKKGQKYHLSDGVLEVG